MRGQAKDSYEFGDFRIDSVERVLLRAGEPVLLTPKVFEILLLLVENNGHVVEKEKLINEIWRGTFVEEGNLTQNISVLRKILGDGAEGRQYIQTIPRRGYRFVARIRTLAEVSDELIVEEHSRSTIVVEQSDHADAEIARVIDANGQRLLPPQIKTGPSTLLSRRVFLAAGAGLFVLVIAGLLWRSSHKSNLPVARAPIKSIAVLPLKSLGGDTKDDYLGLGIADTIIAKISQIRGLTVRPTSAVRKYVTQEIDSSQAAKQLKVESVLEGSVQRDAERIRVSVQLVDVKESRTLWARTFDEKSTSIFAVEDAISEHVAQSMTVELTEAERAQLGKHYTVDPQAHELYLQGRFYLNKFTEDGTKLARNYFDQAISQDPNYALAYSGLAESYAFGEIGLPPQEALPKGRDAATKALDLDETLGQAHAVLAQVGFLWDWDWAAAEKQFKRAIELNPSDPEIHHMYAHYLSAMGRFPEALAESQRLLELDPLSPASRNHLGWHYLYAHEFDQAIEQYKLVLAVDPNFAEAHRQLAEAYAEKARFDEAVAEMNRRFELIGQGDDVPALKKAYSAFGWKGYWQKRLQFSLERSGRSYVRPSGIAENYVQLGDTSRALDWLERAYREHDHDLVYLKVDHTWDSLRSEPRFQELLRRMRLA